MMGTTTLDLSVDKVRRIKQSRVFLPMVVQDLGGGRLHMDLRLT